MPERGQHEALAFYSSASWNHWIARQKLIISNVSKCRIFMMCPACYCKVWMYIAQFREGYFKLWVRDVLRWRIISICDRSLKLKSVSHWLLLYLYQTTNTGENRKLLGWLSSDRDTFQNPSGQCLLIKIQQEITEQRSFVTNLSILSQRQEGTHQGYTEHWNLFAFALTLGKYHTVNTNIMIFIRINDQ